MLSGETEAFFHAFSVRNPVKRFPVVKVLLQRVSSRAEGTESPEGLPFRIEGLILRTYRPEAVLEIILDQGDDNILHRAIRQRETGVECGVASCTQTRFAGQDRICRIPFAAPVDEGHYRLVIFVDPPLKVFLQTLGVLPVAGNRDTECFGRSIVEILVEPLRGSLIPDPLQNGKLFQRHVRLSECIGFFPQRSQDMALGIRSGSGGFHVRRKRESGNYGNRRQNQD